jgi:hypothetical protein
MPLVRTSPLALFLARVNWLINFSRLHASEASAFHAWPHQKAARMSARRGKFASSR